MKRFFLFLIFAHACSVRGNGIKALEGAINDLSTNVGNLTTGYLGLKSQNSQVVEQLKIKDQELKGKENELEEKLQSYQKQNDRLEQDKSTLEEKFNKSKSDLETTQAQLKEQIDRANGFAKKIIEQQKQLSEKENELEIVKKGLLGKKNEPPLKAIQSPEQINQEEAVVKLQEPGDQLRQKTNEPQTQTDSLIKQTQAYNNYRNPLYSAFSNPSMNEWSPLYSITALKNEVRGTTDLTKKYNPEEAVVEVKKTEDQLGNNVLLPLNHAMDKPTSAPWKSHLSNQIKGRQLEKKGAIDLKKKTMRKNHLV